MWRAFVGVIILLLMWILILYKRINELEEEKLNIVKDTIKELNNLRKKEKKNVK